MKLESQKTLEFDQKELRRLAESSRPRRAWGWRAWALAGAMTGALIVAIMRML